jgi:hypothetical protein
MQQAVRIVCLAMLLRPMHAREINALAVAERLCFLHALQQFKAQRGRPRGDLPALIAELGLDQRVLNQPWVELSVCIPLWVSITGHMCSCIFAQHYNDETSRYASPLVSRTGHMCACDFGWTTMRGAVGACHPSVSLTSNKHFAP